MNLALKELLRTLSPMNVDEPNEINEVESAVEAVGSRESIGAAGSVESVSKTLESDSLNFPISDDFQLYLSSVGLHPDFIANLTVLLKKALSKKDVALHNQLLDRLYQLLNVKKEPTRELTQTPQNIKTDPNNHVEIDHHQEQETRQLPSNFKMAYIECVRNYLASNTDKTQQKYLQRGIILTSIACALIVGIIAAHFLARLVISTLICVSITAISVLAASLICGYLFWQNSNIKNINTMLRQVVEAIAEHSSSEIQTSTGNEASVKKAVAAINPVLSRTPQRKVPIWGQASPSSFVSPTTKLGLMTGSSPDANVLSPDPDLFPPPPAGRHFSSQRK